MSDVNWEVRKEMCRGLPSVFQLVGPEHVEKDLFQDLVDIMDDEEADVKAVAISTLGILFEFSLIPPHLSQSGQLVANFA